MKPRERQLATLRRVLTDRLSVDAICVENVAGIAAFLQVDEREVPARLGLDGRLVSADTYLGPPLNSDIGQPGDEWGTAAFDDYGTGHRYPLAEAGTVAAIERHAWPDPGQYDFARAAAQARLWCADYAVRGPYWKPLFCRVCSLMGMEEALVSMANAPHVFEAVLERVFGLTGEYCRRFVEACGPNLDIFCLGDDFATQRGLLFDPVLWRRFLKPRYAALFAIAKRAGKPVWFHSCGDITAILPDLIDIGMDVWETVQLHALPMSARELKRRYGRHITFFGGVNTQRLPFMTPAQVGAEVDRCIEVLGEGGGYICGPDHHIKPDVPPANTVALFETARRFQRTGYTA